MLVVIAYRDLDGDLHGSNAWPATGVSGRAMMRALIAGETDTQALAELANGRMRTKIGAPGRKP